MLSNKTEKRSYKMYYTGAEPSPPERQLIDVPKLIAEIKTKMDISVNYLVCPVFVMKIYGLVATTKPWISTTPQRGELVKSVQTESRNYPQDIAVKKVEI